MKTNKLNAIVKPVIDAAISKEQGDATFFNLLAAKWKVAKGSGFGAAEFRQAIYDGLDEMATTIHFADGSSKEKPMAVRSTVNLYLLRIDEEAFRLRAKRSDAGKDKKAKPAATVGYTQAKIVQAAATIGLTKAQVKALFSAMEA